MNLDKPVWSQRRYTRAKTRWLLAGALLMVALFLTAVWLAVGTTLLAAPLLDHVHRLAVYGMGVVTGATMAGATVTSAGDALNLFRNIRKGYYA